MSTLGGGSETQIYLNRLLAAVESYFYPANANSASETLHSFIQMLSSCFINRVFMERHNRKWACKIPAEKRLTDLDIDEFVNALVPILKHVLYSNFDDEKKIFLNHLATLRPNVIIPILLEQFYGNVASLTEPARFLASLTGLAACSRALVEHYPADVIKIFTDILPGIDVNDIWKSTDIFILMSDLLEMIYLADFSRDPALEKDCLSADEAEILRQSHVWEDFVLRFVDRCFRLIEHSSREQIRQEDDNNVMDEVLNDEEVAADAAIGDTFQKIMSKCSSYIFDKVFEKLKKYILNNILEAAVAGGIFAGMCKSVVVIKPEMTLKFFIPHLCRRINDIVSDKNRHLQDQELRFNLLLLSEVVNVKTVGFNVNPPRYLLPFMETLKKTLNNTLNLSQKEDNEIASNALQNILFNFSHSRILQRKKVPAIIDDLKYGPDYRWGQSGDLDTLGPITWYQPDNEILKRVSDLLQNYLEPILEKLNRFARGILTLDKETLLRYLRLVNKVVHGASSVLAPINKSQTSSLASILKSLDSINVTLSDGSPVRKSVFDTCHLVQKYLVDNQSDDTDSLDTIITIYEVLLFSFGLDEDDLNDHMDEHRTIKFHRENRLIRNKKHLESVLIDRILIQYESFIWLKNLLLTDQLSVEIIDNIFTLATYRYSEVRSFAQDLLNKILSRPTVESLHGDVILPKLIKCLSPEATHEEFKGALHVIHGEKYQFCYSWKMIAQLFPAIVSAQHSDKDSIVELLKEISYKSNRTYADCVLFHIPTKKPVIISTSPLLTSLKEDQKEDPDYLSLEKQLVKLVNGGTLHWRHYQMAIGMLLSLVNSTHVPFTETINLWLEALVHDDRMIRLVAFQAVEAILKGQFTPCIINKLSLSEIFGTLSTYLVKCP